MALNFYLFTDNKEGLLAVSKRVHLGDGYSYEDPVKLVFDITRFAETKSLDMSSDWVHLSDDYWNQLVKVNLEDVWGDINAYLRIFSPNGLGVSFIQDTIDNLFFTRNKAFFPSEKVLKVLNVWCEKYRLFNCKSASEGVMIDFLKGLLNRWDVYILEASAYCDVEFLEMTYDLKLTSVGIRRSQEWGYSNLNSLVYLDSDLEEEGAYYFSFCDDNKDSVIDILEHFKRV